MKQELASALVKAVASLGIEASTVKLEYPESPKNGDFSTNIALVNAKVLEVPPRKLAEKIVVEFDANKPDFIESVSIAGPGFINFKLKDKVFSEQIIKIAESGAEYGWSKTGIDKKVMVEYTDPNPFKIFHIGHLMANAIGESISRLIESSGTKVIRACYQGDVGLHVAKTIWAIKSNYVGDIQIIKDKDLVERVDFLGMAYFKGSTLYEGDEQFWEPKINKKQEEVKKEVGEINKKIFEKSDPEINKIYDEGKKWSLEYFDKIYKKLGTKFDKFFFESEVADAGIQIVKEFLKKSVFEESDGAIIFKGENHGLHTRVFITSNGLPTYEAKELGLNTKKFELYPDLDESVIVTANEINDYFKVLLKALSFINPEVASKTKHLSHGILRFASGKMSSRKGNVISAESLIDDVKELVKKKMTDDKIHNSQFTIHEIEETTDSIAIAAIKYTILRQSIGGDVIFDSSASVSFEGDSGPYLQYSAVRAASVLEKASDVIPAKAGIQGQTANIVIPKGVSLLEKLISRFPDIIERARTEYAPQLVANYLINLAGAFNSFYASKIIIDEKDPLSPYRLALTQAFLTTMTNGLWVLGIKVPKKM